MIFPLKYLLFCLLQLINFFFFFTFSLSLLPWLHLIVLHALAITKKLKMKGFQRMVHAVNIFTLLFLYRVMSHIAFNASTQLKFSYRNTHIARSRLLAHWGLHQQMSCSVQRWHLRFLRLSSLLISLPPRTMFNIAQTFLTFIDMGICT